MGVRRRLPDEVVVVRRARLNPDDRSLLGRLQIIRADDPQWSWGKKGRYVTLHAIDERTADEVGRIDLRVKRKHATPSQVWVWPKYRRKGVASWLYRVAEQILGVEVRHSGNLTNDGKAFKRGRRR